MQESEQSTVFEVQIIYFEVTPLSYKTNGNSIYNGCYMYILKNVQLFSQSDESLTSIMPQA